MTNERDDQQSSQSQDSNKQAQHPTAGQQDSQPTESEAQPSPTDSQSGGQAATGQSAEDSDTLTSHESEQESSQIKGEGFVGSKSSDSSEYLQEDGKTDSDIEGSTDKPPLDGE